MSTPWGLHQILLWLQRRLKIISTRRHKRASMVNQGRPVARNARPVMIHMVSQFPYVIIHRALLRSVIIIPDVVLGVDPWLGHGDAVPGVCRSELDVVQVTSGALLERVDFVSHAAEFFLEVCAGGVDVVVVSVVDSGGEAAGVFCLVSEGGFEFSEALLLVGEFSKFLGDVFFGGFGVVWSIFLFYLMFLSLNISQLLLLNLSNRIQIILLPLRLQLNLLKSSFSLTQSFLLLFNRIIWWPMPRSRPRHLLLSHLLHRRLSLNTIMNTRWMPWVISCKRFLNRYCCIPALFLESSHLFRIDIWSAM